MNISEAWSLAFVQPLLSVFILCAILCAIGFIKFLYFISVGYGLAIAGAGAALIRMYSGVISMECLFLCLLLVLYGLRLSGYLLYRELTSAAYRKTLYQERRRDKPVPIFISIVVWILVSMMYVAEVSPVIYRLSNGVYTGLMPKIGAGVMGIALIIEALADKQKSDAKKLNPARFCDTGLYKIVRCPNYFGEILFWTGVLLSGVGALSGIVQWAIAILGYLLLVYVMLSGAKRLEIRQNKSYGDNVEYKSYVKDTPILLPLIPIYHLASVKFIKA